MMEYKDIDDTSRLSSDAIVNQLNSATGSPIYSECNILSSNCNNINNNNSNNSSISTNSTTSINLTNSSNNSKNQQPMRSNEVHSVILYDIPIIALIMEGQERLCLAQISNTLLKPFTYNEIHNRRVALGIQCIQCTPVQLESLRRAGAMPVSSRRCGMITKKEAERLCKSFLDVTPPPKLPENFEFHIYHKCSFGCKGSFLPGKYNSSRAKCIKCSYCLQYFSPNKFIFHSHETPGSTFIKPDAANFNSWRRHIKLNENTSEDVHNLWEEVKAMFNGGSRKRALSATLNSVSKQQQQQKQHQQQVHQQNILSQNLVSGSLNSNQSNNATTLGKSNRLGFKNLKAVSYKTESKLNLSEEEDDEELNVDDDRNTPLSINSNTINVQNNTNLNFASNQLFSPSNNSIIKNDIQNCTSNTQANIDSLSNILSYQVSQKKIFNHQQIIDAFANFKNNSYLNSSNNSFISVQNNIDDLALSLNQANSSLNNANNPSSLPNQNRSNSGPTDVVSAMLPILGQDFIWPSHHSLNSISQLGNSNNLSSNTQSLATNPCSASLQTNQLNSIISNNQNSSALSSNNLSSNFCNKNSFPLLYNNNPSLLFSHQTHNSGIIIPSNNSSNLSQQNSSDKTNSNGNWLNFNTQNDNCSNQLNSSAFRKVNTVNKILEENCFPSKKTAKYNDFTVENLSKPKKNKLSNTLQKLLNKEDELNIDIEGEEEIFSSVDSSKKLDLKSSIENNFNNSNELEKNIKSDKTLKKKTNSNSFYDEKKNKEEIEKNSDLNNDSNKSLQMSIIDKACQKTDCNCKALTCIQNHEKIFETINKNVSTTSSQNEDKNVNLFKKIDLSNVNSLIKNDQDFKSINNKDTNFVNNLMVLNKLNEVINPTRNYNENALLKEELEKQFQLLEYLRNTISVNKTEYIHQKIN